MHRSRVSTLLIDVPADEVAQAVTFWSGALGVTARSVPGEPQFTSLAHGVGTLVTAVQSIGDAQRYHLDFETDNLDAEQRRLEALGAVEVSRWLECRTLRAPGGHLLCVIPVHSEPQEFADHAHIWP